MSGGASVIAAGKRSVAIKLEQAAGKASSILPIHAIVLMDLEEFRTGPAVFGQALLVTLGDGLEARHVEIVFKIGQLDLAGDRVGQNRFDIGIIGRPSRSPRSGC